MEIAVESFLVGGDKPTTTSNIALSAEVFSVSYNLPVIHQVVVAYAAAARSGSKKNKGRSEVRGGGRKPWRQKGTGRARSGSNTSPIWRGGGVTFAAKPRGFSQKVNRKMYRLALRSILSEHVRLGSIKVVEHLSCKTPKTKDFVEIMGACGMVGKVYVIANTLDSNLSYASRNISSVRVTTLSGIDPLSLYSADVVVLEKATVAAIEGWLA